MAILFSWLLFAFLAGMIGSNRKIGFWPAFLLSLFLSPFVGGIVALASTSKAQAELIEQMKKQNQKPPQKAPASVADELHKLKTLLEEGHISPEEYEAAKKKMLA